MDARLVADRSRLEPRVARHATAGRIALRVPFAAPWNLAGWPAMVVPAGVHLNGTPLSVQLVGRPGTEAQLLAVAAQLELLSPWSRIAPSYA